MDKLIARYARVVVTVAVLGTIVAAQAEPEILEFVGESGSSGWTRFRSR